MKRTVMEWAYVAVCLLVPAGWGALSAWLFSLRDRQAASNAARRPPVDYTI